VYGHNFQHVWPVQTTGYRDIATVDLIHTYWYLISLRTHVY